MSSKDEILTGPLTAMKSNYEEMRRFVKEASELVGQPHSFTDADGVEFLALMLKQAAAPQGAQPVSPIPGAIPRPGQTEASRFMAVRGGVNPNPQDPVADMKTQIADLQKQTQELQMQAKMQQAQAKAEQAASAVKHTEEESALAKELNEKKSRAKLQKLQSKVKTIEQQSQEQQAQGAQFQSRNQEEMPDVNMDIYGNAGV